MSQHPSGQPAGQPPREPSEAAGQAGPGYASSGPGYPPSGPGYPPPAAGYPPPGGPGFWRRATATSGRRWGLAAVAVALVLGLFLVVGLGAALVFRRELGHGIGPVRGPLAGQLRRGGQGVAPFGRPPGHQNMPGPALRGLGGLARLGAATLHGEVTVRGANGQSQVLLVQAGAVTAVSSSSISLRSSDGFTGTYGIDASTRVRGGSISAVQTGQAVVVLAHKDTKVAVLVAGTRSTP